MSNRLVELARFLNSAEAAVFRGILEAEGVRAGVFGEAMAGWFWHWVSAIGGVRLVVAEDDAAQALKVLRSQVPIDRNQAMRDVCGGEQTCDSAVPAELTRAWRAAVLGTLLLPVVLSLYSIWILGRHHRVACWRRNWRFAAAWFLNALVVSLAVLALIAGLVP